MPSTSRKLNQFGNEAHAVAAYISLRRSLLAVGGIQVAVGIVLLIAGIILGFGIAGFVTLSVLVILGILGLVAGFISQPIDAPFVVARRVRRIKMIAGGYMFLLATVFLVAAVTLGWEFWQMALVSRARMEDGGVILHYPFANAILVVACAVTMLITIVPLCAFGMDFGEMSKPKIPMEQ
ncbi:hypothetical protein RvY_00288 [Ramazzottius varieornatus]|uniref:Transmembrane protein n=1 Tax=Ramazzottius varieornatus TaxID=947166 RepID=A0A1D1UIL2_RAMVA|nr:hypothetical protein RvY_00288 [Ramazzottius varieornatus]